MITIEFSFAWILCALMVLVIIATIYNIITTPEDILATICKCILLILTIDIFCAIGSALYMSHPTNGYEVNSYLNKCAEFNYTTNSFNEPTQCIMPIPQDNPYEKQPLHPIAWFIEVYWDVMKSFAGAIKFKAV